MHASRPALRARFVRQTVLAGALFAALAAGASAQAARVGHARMVSVSGQPLAVELALREVAPEQISALAVSAAPASAWRDAGLTPPVALDSLAFQVVPGPVKGAQLIRVRSSQAFHGDIADLLLDIRSDSGQLRHQVSVMAPDARSPGVVLAPSQGQGAGAGAGVSTAGTGGAPGAAASGAPGSIRVKRGDTLFSIARNNAVPGTSVYQMMMALQAINPEAFIDGNVNRLKAGASLRLPDASELAVLSDAEARRLFHEQGEAFAAYRDRIAGMRGEGASAKAAQGLVASPAASSAGTADAPAGDQLVLSKASADADTKADDRLASDKNIAESRDRIAQLEENVQALSQAVGQGSGGQGDAAGGEAAAPPGGAASGDSAAGGGNAQAAGGSGDGATAGANGGAGAQGAGSGDNASASANGAASAAGSAAGGASGAAAGVAAGTSAQQSGASAPADGQAAAPAGGQAAQGADQAKSWWQDNMLWIITGLLALLVLLLVWWLRRAGVNRGDAERGAPITEDMVKQKLEQIDLDLGDLPDEPKRPGGGKSA